MRPAGGLARVGWTLTALILLSFAFGVAMYSDPVQRAQKLEEIRHKYEAKQALRARPPAGPQS